MTVGTPLLWVGFLAFIALMLAIDLGVFHKEARGLSKKEAIGWFAVWVGLAAAFAGFIYWKFGKQDAYEFAAGYLLEESLSVDNIFVIILVFKSFRVPPKYQHRVLVWGIIGAVILRAALIIGGTALVNRFHWLNYAFGAFLVYTGLKLFFAGDDEENENPEEGRIVKMLRKIIPTSRDFHEQHFFTVENGKRLATPLLIVLITVELSDVIFALDSIPAIFGVTTDPFIVFTSNIFAILGLRTLFFLVSGMIDAFRFLKLGLAFILTFIGAKMCFKPWYDISIGISLGVIAAVLVLSIIASRLIPEKK